MNNFNKILAFIIAVFFISKSEAQLYVSQNNYFELSMQNGFTIPSLQQNKYYIQSHLNGINLFIGKTNSDSVNWSKTFRTPVYGAGMQWQQFSENKILGSAFSLYYKICIPFFPVRKWGVYYSTAIGTSIIPKAFQPQVHYLNHANGSKFNVFVHFGLQTRIKLYRNFMLLWGVNYYHISNGNIKLPNDGLNLLAAEMGIDYKFSSNKKTRILNNKALPEQGKFYLSISLGSKQIKILDNNYLISVFDAGYYPFILKKRSFGIGADMVIDKSLQYKIQTDSSFINNNGYLYNSVYFSHTLNLNKIKIVTNVGIYIDYNKIIDNNLFYYIGLRYNLYKNILGTFGLKANLNGGDFITWGLGYSF